MGAQFGWFFLICGLVFSGLILFAVVYKLVEVNRSRHWSVTTGQVVTSKVRAGKKGSGKGHTHIVNYPAVVYEYKVGKKRYRGERISIGEQAGNVNVAETLARYPLGREVQVYYNPANPAEAVLERDLPPDFGKGLTLILVIFLGGAIVLLAVFTSGLEVLAGWLPEEGNPLLATLLGGGGLFVALLALALQRQVAAAKQWNAVQGEVVSAEIESYRSQRIRGYSGFRILYRPVIVYRYNVAGQQYSSDRVTFGGQMGWSAPWFIKGRVARYPPGSRVQVYYDPQNPAESVLECRASGGVLLWLVAGALLLLAVAAAGLF